MSELPDGAQIHFAGSSSIEIPFGQFPVGSLSYRPADVATETELVVWNVSVSSGLAAFPGQNDPATLTSETVAVIPESFGALKAKFRP